MDNFALCLSLLSPRKPSAWTNLSYTAVVGLLVFGLTAVCSAQKSASQLGYIYTTVDDPNTTTGTYLNGINNAGIAVGYYAVSNPSTPSDIGFSHSGSFTPDSNSYADIPGQGTTLSTGPNPIAMANAVNSSGTIVGDYKVQTTGTGASTTYYGFVDTNGAYQKAISDPKVQAYSSTYIPLTNITDINTAGTLAGYYDKYNSATKATTFYGFLDTNGTYSDIIDPSASAVTEVRGINDNGQAVGFYEDSSSTFHGFVDTLSTNSYTTLNILGAANTYVKGINNLGQVVGYYSDSSGLYHGFEDTFTAAGLSSSYVTFNDPSATDGTFINGINDSGDVIGYYNVSTVNGDISHGLYSAAPEPSQMTVLGLVAFGLGGRLLRARKKVMAG